MSRFEVTPVAVADVSARLAGISGQLGELHGHVSGHLSAAEGTPAAGALHGLMGQWARMLPLYAEAGDRLCAAVAGAARGYESSDEAIAERCAGPEESGEGRP